jgi:hypothetical protein
LPSAKCEAAVKSIVLIVRSLFALCGLALLGLGGLFWSGRALSLLPFHMLLGTVFVICMWVLAVIGLLAPATRALAVFVLIWSLVVPAVGVGQLQLLPGADHWVIQVVHLLVGLIAGALGGSLAHRIGRRAVPASAVPESV